jgi:hypothetical protein
LAQQSTWKKETLWRRLNRQSRRSFLTTLAEGKDVDAEKIKQLREQLVGGKKPKADDFVKIFAGSEAETSSDQA